VSASVRAVTDDRLTWGESVRWDERRQRLYLVDCATRRLHWLEGGEGPLVSLPEPLPGLPTGVVLSEDGRLVVALDDGLHVVDPDAATTERLTTYPEELGGRANDANADGHGGLVTGTLNLGPGPGTLWRYSVADGWQHLASGTGNTNGPVVVGDRLVVADTVAREVHEYPYDGAAGTAGERRTLLDVATLGGRPDGACADAEGGVWSCVLGAGAIVRLVDGEVVQRVEPGVEQPSDVTFGGPDLDRMFVVSIALELLDGPVTSPLAGAVVALDGVGVRGRPEPRFAL
jgi:L-arabinonolactonase